MDIQAATSILTADPNYRVLRRINGPKPLIDVQSWDPYWKTVAVLDCETTGLHPEGHQIIELSIGLLHLDNAGWVHSYDEPRTWLEEPEWPLSEEIAALTGLTDEMLSGQAISDEEVAMTLQSADLLVSWNAAFDARFFERRFPQLRGLCWGCAMTEVDWKARGLEPGKQSHVLMQQGYFYDAHRAGDDVAALMTGLAHPVSNGMLPIAELYRTASRQSAVVWARYSHFDAKDHLKARGYRWQPEARCWWTEVDEHQIEDEREWLRALDHRIQPDIVTVDWTNRHRN